MKNPLLELNLRKCSQCGNSDIIPKSVIDKENGFYMWMECSQCDNISNSAYTLLDAAIEWNNKNKVGG